MQIYACELSENEVIEYLLKIALFFQISSQRKILHIDQMETFMTLELKRFAASEI